MVATNYRSNADCQWLLWSNQIDNGYFRFGPEADIESIRSTVS
jgi:hypothetical protein